jgi:uncharacterized protein YbgA (DUF1722 family)/uncharacterized protein YbbK (DUF523 family)
MNRFPRPRVVASRCLEFDACRHDGQRIPNEMVRGLEKFVEFLPVCPEVEIGLGTPRNSIRIVTGARGLRLLQPEGNRDLTDRMEKFSRRHLDGLEEIDGFILKNRSPSCAPFDARYYPTVARQPAQEKGPGLFAGVVRDRFPSLAIEDEGRLRNPRIREHFLSKIFTLARFRAVRKSNAIRTLVRFQAEHKLLLMGYHQTKMRQLGALVAGYKRVNLQEIFSAYEEGLQQALKRPPRRPAMINVLQHAFGYFSRDLGSAEKRNFLLLLDRFRAGKAPLSAPVALLRSWIARFDQDYLASQIFFEPFPEELTEVEDSSRRKDYAFA